MTSPTLKPALYDDDCALSLLSWLAEADASPAGPHASFVFAVVESLPAGGRTLAAVEVWFPGRT
jgi:hypothetical protein